MKLQVKKVKPHLVQGTAGFEQVRKMFWHSWITVEHVIQKQKKENRDEPSPDLDL